MSKLKPGDLREWNPHTLLVGDYIVDEHDASSPFLVLSCTLVNEYPFTVEVLDSQGRKMKYDKRVIEELTRSVE